LTTPLEVDYSGLEKWTAPITPALISLVANSCPRAALHVSKYLATFAAFLGTVGEGFIIDTDHWRHFWLMLGVMWGMYVAAERYKTAPEAVVTGEPVPAS